MMAELDRVTQLERRLADALASIHRLTALEAVRECIYRVCRAIDRIDAGLLRSAFHPDAIIHFGKIYDGGVDGWVASAMNFQAAQSQTHHLVGNITVRINKDEAFAESYELARHKTPVNGKLCDLVLAMRTLDRLSRRDGEWRISERTKVMDWGRIINGDEGIYENSPLEKGLRDKSDASYGLFSR
jgi:SnoaL-like domain